MLAIDMRKIGVTERIEKGTWRVGEKMLSCDDWEGVIIYSMTCRKEP